MFDFISLYNKFDKKIKIIDGIVPLLLDKNVLFHSVEQLHMTVQRAVIKELFEGVKSYCKSTKQSNLLISQNWYQLWRIMRNCFSHDYRFRFNDHDKKFMPISWKGIELDESMDGELITIGHLSYENIWDLINEVEIFVKNELT
jgi:hypothetical protein